MPEIITDIPVIIVNTVENNSKTCYNTHIIFEYRRFSIILYSNVLSVFRSPVRKHGASFFYAVKLNIIQKHRR